MTLSALIRKRDTANLATAIPAIPATQPKGKTTAIIATEKEANPKEGNTVHLANVGIHDTSTTSRWWLIYYQDQDPEKVACCPEASYSEILKWRPDAIAAKPFTPAIRKPLAPLTAEDEMVIRAWMALIKETDSDSITEVIGQCQQNAEAREYIIGRAAAELPLGQHAVTVEGANTMEGNVAGTKP